MADAPKILGSDTLRIAYPKINQAIDNSNEALTKAVTAETDAADAKTISENVQTQLNTVVINGDSSVEAAQARVDPDGYTFPTLKDRLDTEYLSVTELIAEREKDLEGRGVNAMYPPAPSVGAKGDGTTDDTSAIQNLINNFEYVLLPPFTFRVTDTIKVGTRGKALFGTSWNVRGYGMTSTILYDGTLNRHKSVVLVGANTVDSEPTVDGSDNIVKNIMINANNLAGFGIYGTYLTNETVIDNIVTSNTLEYGMYFAKAWYATFTNLRAVDSKGQGIALGMPLEYLDGTKVTWTTAAALEVNNCQSENLRAINCGKYFSVDNPNTYDPTNALIRRKGYGLGFGVGNAFNVGTFLSEKNGGVGVYVFTESQPIKVIKGLGYIENNCLNSGLDPTSTMAHMIIENASATGGNIYIRDVFMNYNYGGIYHVGVLGRKVWLENIQQPRFLKSLDGLTNLQLYAEVLKKNVYHDCGMYNTLETIATTIDKIQTVDTRSFVPVTSNPSIGYKLIFIKGSGTTPWGSYTLNYEDGTTASRSYPSNLGTSYVLATVANGNLTSITKAGGTGETPSNVTFKIVDTPFTHI